MSNSTLVEALVDALAEPAALLDRSLHVLAWNEAAESTFAVSRGDARGRALTELLPQVTDGIVRERVEEVLRSGQPAWYRCASGQGGDACGCPPFVVRPAPPGVLWVVGKAAEEGARGPAPTDREALYGAVVSELPQLVVRARPSGEVLFANEAYREFFGIAPERVTETNFFDLFPAHFHEVMRARFAGLTPAAPRLRFDRWANDHRGRPRFLDISIHGVFDGEGRLCELQTVKVDITERRETEESLRRQVDERDVLLRELHHRSKNNLQMLTGMLRLELGDSEDRATRAAVATLQRRILTLAIVHEALYRSPSPTSLELGPYVERIARHAYDTRHRSGAEIELRLDLAAVPPIAAGAVMRVGLILHELVSNSLEHAFVGRPSGIVTVTLVRAAQRIALSIHDDGVGMPLEGGDEPTMGLVLVKELANHLGGELEIESNGRGTRVTLSMQEGDEGGEA